MIDAETLKDLMSIKLESKKAAATSIWRPLATFGMQRLTNKEIWSRFVNADPAEIMARRAEYGEEGWAAYLKALYRAAPDDAGRRMVRAGGSTKEAEADAPIY